MKKIQLLNKIAKVGTDVFGADYEIAEQIDNPDAIMVRSASMHEMTFGDNLKAIARAGAGVNNIPIEACAEQGIVVFNTPGANANGVKELAVAALLLASRDIVGGIAWANSLAGTEGVAKQVEKGKSKFAGCELKGKRLGVIGLGAIGGMVANIATHLGMEVVGCDPYLSVEGAWSLSRSVRKAASYEEIYETCDYISLHVPATPQTKGMINKDTIATMKDGVRIINLARADLVNAQDVKDALASGKMASYVTDFPTEETVATPGIVTIPHLGASTAESEDNCAVMAAQELVEYLTNGNIKNSVNYPNASMPHNGDLRICVMHQNVPGALAQINATIAQEKLNVSNMLNRSRGDYAYTILEVVGTASDEMIAQLRAIKEVIRVTVYR
jgi:D-3-phosphoglycerate dehydrogenase